MITEKYIRAFAHNLNQLRQAAADFISSENKKINETRYVDSDEIEIDLNTRSLVWSYEYNTSCHCHPEMERVRKEFSFKDFAKWIADNNVEIEQLTETDIDWD